MQDDRRYNRMRVKWQDYLVPNGYELSPIGSFYRDSSHFICSHLKNGSVNLIDWIKIRPMDDDKTVIEETFYPCIRKKVINDDGKHFACKFKINKK